jgi:hypothetical protein
MKFLEFYSKVHKRGYVVTGTKDRGLGGTG